MPALSTALEAVIDCRWAGAQARMRGRLFNGLVFSADTMTADLVTGHWTEFRRIVAQMDRPDLFAELHVRPLAVNGALHGPDGVAFGQRQAGAVYQPGQWQLAPAGSVDDGAARPGGTVDVLAAVLAELREEFGGRPASARDPRPLAIVEHAGSHVLDLGITLRTALAAGQIRATHAASGNGEYPALEVVAMADLPDFLSREAGNLTPQALVFLACPAFRSGLEMPPAHHVG
jgi:hypothetical protein